MRWRVPFMPQAAAFAACSLLLAVLARVPGEVLSRGVSELVFHITTYDENSNPLQQGQGVVVGAGGVAIISVSTLEGAASAVALMMDGSRVPVLGIITQDSITGLAAARLQHEPPWVSGKPVETGQPEAGARVLYSALSKRAEQACIACIITSVKAVPDLEDLYYVEATRPLPPPGGAVFSSDGTMVGIVLYRTADIRQGILASEGRLSLLGKRDAVEASLDKWISQKHTRWEERIYTRYLLGQVALWQGRPAETVEYIEDHVRALPEFASSMTALLGEAYLTLDLLPEAVHALKAAIDLGSPPVRVYRELAWAYMEAGQYGLAESMCRNAIRMDSECSSGYTLMAHLHNLQGNYRHAIYEAKRALLREPDCPCAYFERGRGYIGLARYRSAIDSLETATNLDPTYGEAFNSLGYARLRSGGTLRAIAALQEAVRLEPEMAEAWDNLGAAYSRAGYPDKAVHALRLAVCLDPSRSSGYCRLAREFISQKRYLDAVDIVQQGLDRCEGSQWLVYYLGKALLYEGRGDLARIQADRLCKENRKLANQLTRLIEISSDI